MGLKNPISSISLRGDSMLDNANEKTAASKIISAKSKKRTEEKKTYQYYVYVIELKRNKFLKNYKDRRPPKKFRDQNPHIWGVHGTGMTKKVRFYYVGQSTHEPKCRFKQHKRCFGKKINLECKCSAGPVTITTNRSNSYVRNFGTMLRPWKYRDYNPIKSRAEAEQKEKELAEEIRSENHAVYFA